MANKTLELQAGMKLEVLSNSNEVLFQARARNYDGKLLRIVRSDNGAVPFAKGGTEYKLRGYLPDGSTELYHATVYGCTDTTWTLHEVANWFTWERREYFRQGILVSALVRRTYLADDTPVWNGSVECKLLDISGGGVQLVCDASYYVGDTLVISDAELLPNEEPFSFRCIVRRTEPVRHGYRYGCQFDEMDSGEQDRLIRAIFRLQREETHRLREQ